jgi:putative hydrolase of the HAD superfamily
MDKTPLLLIDADDTIWESALYFRRAEEDFVCLLEALGHDPDEVVSTVHARDIERLEHTGYGALPYMDTLTHVMELLHPDPPGWAVRSLDSIRRTLLGHPVILLPGVAPTLSALAEGGHATFVYTMGERSHQMDKFRRSGLDGTVHGVRVLERKTPEALGRLLEELEGTPANTAVIGNSPRSDIRPALEIGVNAVHVHRPGTWVAEQADIPESDRLRQVSSFHGVPGALCSLGLAAPREEGASARRLFGNEAH